MWLLGRSVVLLFVALAVAGEVVEAAVATIEVTVLAVINVIIVDVAAAVVSWLF